MIKKNIIIDGLNINFYRSGVFSSPKMLIFLHGWKAEAGIFKKILEKCDNFIALDFPGFGGSELPQDAWNVAKYATFLHKFLIKMEIKNPILVGHSFGGSVAIKYNVLFNEVEKNILIGLAGIRKKSPKLKLYAAGAKFFKLTSLIPGFGSAREKIRKNFYKSIESVDYIDSGKLKETYKKIVGEDLGPDMKKVKTETVLIWGENDAETPLADGRKINQLIKNSKLLIIKNAGHYAFLDQPEKFNELLFQELC